MAMACPLEKELIKEKIKQMNDNPVENQNRTYAQVANTVANKVIKETCRKPTPTLCIHTSTELRITIAEIHTHMHNLIAPGTYATELNMTLVKQGLPTIEAPYDPPSGNLFNIKISDVFNAEERQTALELQKQLTTQLEQTIGGRQGRVPEPTQRAEIRNSAVTDSRH